MSSTPQCEAMAEDALLLRFGDAIDVAINAQVHAAARRLHARCPGLEIVPAYASLLLRFDPAQWPAREGRSPHEQLIDTVLAALQQADQEREADRQVDIPVLYGGECGPDLAEVAILTALSVEQVIARHAAASYRVAMLGFAPGFPYLLGLDPGLATPRRHDPRQRVPAGSVAIGGSQTGIYPAELPGGWRLIGRTPLRLFHVDAPTPSLLRPGDRVRFQPIDAATFERLAGAATP